VIAEAVFPYPEFDCKIGGAHSHVLLAEGAGCVSVGGLACLTSREARLNFAGRKSKTSNTAHQGSYHVGIYIYDVSIITYLTSFQLSTKYIIDPDLQAHLVPSYIIFPSSFVQHRPSTTKTHPAVATVSPHSR